MSAFPRQRAALYPKSESTYLTEDLKIFFPPKTHPLHNLKIYVRLYLPIDGKCCSADGFKLYATAIGSTLKKVLKKMK